MVNLLWDTFQLHLSNGKEKFGFLGKVRDLQATVQVMRHSPSAVTLANEQLFQVDLLVNSITFVKTGAFILPVTQAKCSTRDVFPLPTAPSINTG